MAQAGNVISLPIPKITFEPVVFDEAKVVAEYESQRLFLTMCLDVLRMSPGQMKKKVHALQGDPDLPDDVTQNLISDFENCAQRFGAFGDLFVDAAARLSAVHSKLI